MLHGKLHRAALLACMGAAGAWDARAGSEIPPEVLQLARIKQNMAKLLSRVPDYTCTETVQRFHRPPSSERFQLRDTLQLDVAYLGGKEVYSRPGASKFDDRRVGEIVTGGLTSDGDFAIQARTLFLNNTALIRFHGAENLDGHETIRYDYRIGLFSSGWTLRIAGAAAKIAEHGSFWVDAAGLNLLRIERFGDEIPPDLPVSALRSQLDYGKALLDGASVSIPKSSDTVLTQPDGAQDRNNATFSQCHSVRGETVISFDGDPSALHRSAGEVQADVELPPNLPFILALEEAIDSSSASEGDPIAARVTRDLVWKKKLLVGKGTLASGRIRRVGKDGTGWVLELEFVSLDNGANRRVFRAAPADSPDVDKLPGVGSFRFTGENFHLDRGFPTKWRTSTPGHLR